MFLISEFFQPFSIFPHENNTKQDDFNTVRKVRDGATIIVSWEIWPKKGNAYLERDNDTDKLQKFVYIYTFVFTSTYTGPFCNNPVESRPILLGSGSILVESSGMDAFLQESVGIKKYSSGMPFLWWRKHPE